MSSPGHLAAKSRAPALQKRMPADHGTRRTCYSGVRDWASDAQNVFTAAQLPDGPLTSSLFLSWEVGGPDGPAANHSHREPNRTHYSAGSRTWLTRSGSKLCREGSADGYRGEFSVAFTPPWRKRKTVQSVGDPSLGANFQEPPSVTVPQLFATAVMGYRTTGLCDLSRQDSVTIFFTQLLVATVAKSKKLTKLFRDPPKPLLPRRRHIHRSYPVKGKGEHCTEGGDLTLTGTFWHLCHPLTYKI